MNQTKAETINLIKEVVGKEPIYKDFLQSACFIGPITRTPAFSKKKGMVPSERSLSLLEEDGASVYKTIVDRFGIKDTRLFSSKYAEAISGDGHEEGRLLTLISSSLCALLHFYKPEGLLIPLEKGKTMHVVGSGYEYKNTVFMEDEGKKRERPSNVDIVLYGYIEETKVDCLLFLESKYSEYLKDSKGSYSKRYAPLLKKYFGSLSWLKLKESKNTLAFIDDKQGHYYEGIKQMAAHLSGIANLMNGVIYSPQKHQDILESYINEKGVEFYFGEIAYEHDDYRFNQWQRDYGELSFVYNGSHGHPLDENDDIEPKMVNHLLTYQSLFSIEENQEFMSEMEPEIALYYDHETIYPYAGSFAVRENDKHIAFQREPISSAYKDEATVSCSHNEDDLMKVLSSKGVFAKEGGYVQYDLRLHSSIVKISEEFAHNKQIEEAVAEYFHLDPKNTIFVAMSPEFAALLKENQ